MSPACESTSTSAIWMPPVASTATCSGFRSSSSRTGSCPWILVQGVHLCCNARRDDYALHGTRGKGLKVELRVADVDETYARLSGFGVPFAFPPEDKPWGLRSCGRRPGGYRLWFSTPLKAS